MSDISQTNNVGPWFFHCHIDWHLDAGFAVVFAEDVPDIPSMAAPCTYSGETMFRVAAY